jgi:signal transduction histidine kinase/ActR/RegA family two-component response regulator
LSRRLAVLLPAMLVVASLGSFLATRTIVDEQNQRLLEERATSVETLLNSTLQNATSSLKVLGDIANSPEPGALEVFTRVAAQQAFPGVSLGVARKQGSAIVSLAGVGDVAAGKPVAAPRLATVARAQSLRSFVADVEPGQPPRLLLALAVGSNVVYEEFPLVGLGGTDPDNPFVGVQLALYSPEGAGQLLFATGPTPLRGPHVERPFVVGPDTWLLEVVAATPLVGTLSDRLPWLVLAAGLTVAMLLWLALHAISRRREYAERLVTERTAELESARQLRENLLRLSPLMVVRARTSDDSLTYVSPNINALLGIDQALVSDPVAWRDALRPDDLARLEDAVARLKAGTSEQESLELRFRTGDDERCLRDDIVAERNPETGEVVGLISYLQDVTEQRRAEEELRLAHEGAEAANRAKSAFLSSMSHELRTPMNAVLGFAQLLERDELEADQQESVSYILTAGRHLLALINDVLDFSRIEAGTMTMSHEPVHVADLVRESLDLLRGEAAAREIRLEEIVAPDAPTHAQADQQRLKQVLVNLLSNAVKYNVRGGSVTVSVVASPAGRVLVNVTDTGPGIPVERQHELFQPFHRLGAENSAIEGTGIGLALSRQLAEAMGATLGVDSAPGQGSTFWVELPAATEPDLPPPTDAVEVSPALAPDGERVYVLQVEDNPSNIRLLQRVLQDRDDLTLLVAQTGQEGLDLARRYQPRLILLDLHLPDLDGTVVLRRLRQDPATADIPTAIISADATRSHRERLLEAGALAYLTKPYDIAELVRLIDEALVTV